MKYVAAVAAGFAIAATAAVVGASVAYAADQRVQKAKRKRVQRTR